MYGLSTTGGLVKMTQREEGILSSSASWAEWCAEVGEIGALLALSGTILQQA